MVIEILNFFTQTKGFVVQIAVINNWILFQIDCEPNFQFEPFYTYYQVEITFFNKARKLKLFKNKNPKT